MLAQLLPLPSEHMVVEHDYSWDYIYEPESSEILDRC